MAPAALVFDLDGTIWDSYPWYAGILEQLGAMSSESVLRQLLSGGNIMRLLRDAKIPITTFLSAAARTTTPLALYESVQEVLSEVSDLGVPLAIVSGLTPSLAEPMLAGVGLRNLFAVSVFAAKKSSPQPYLRAASSLACPVETSAYVGDMPKDALGASRARMPFWWASYGYSSTAPAEAARRLSSFKDILT